MGRPYADADARSLPGAQAGAARGRRRRRWRTCARASTSWSARAPAARRRSTCAPPTSPTSGSRARPDLPVLVVGDIDRGGVFAALYGTLALLEPADQAHVAGFLINKFRGDHGDPRARPRAAAGADRPADARRAAVARRPVAGRRGLAGARGAAARGAPRRAGGDTLEVAVVRLRWMSNFTDVDALAAEPGVSVRFTRSPADVERADLVVVPGTKATVEDLERLRASGLDRGAASAAPAAATRSSASAAATRCSDERIDDEVESRRRAGRRASACCRCSTTFAREKLLRRVAGHGAAGRRRASARLRDPPRPPGAPRRRAADRRRHGRRRGLRRGRRARHVVARAARGRRVAPRRCWRGSPERARAALGARHGAVRRACASAHLDRLGDLARGARRHRRAARR